jgi:predicted histone-like DNA-binding protein
MLVLTLGTDVPEWVPSGICPTLGYRSIIVLRLKFNIMSIKFHPVLKPNPRDLAAPKQYYASLEKGDDISFDELIEFVGKMSGINEPYIVAVMRTLEKVIIEQLSHGRYVRLGRIGSFYISLNSGGVENAEDLSSRDVKAMKIRFRPGKVMRHATKGFTLQKVS